MMTAAQSLAEIARLLEDALRLPADAHPITLKGLLWQAHTHAVIQASRQRKAEARATFAAYPEIEQGPMQ